MIETPELCVSVCEKQLQLTPDDIPKSSQEELKTKKKADHYNRMKEKKYSFLPTYEPHEYDFMSENAMQIIVLKSEVDSFMWRQKKTENLFTD